MTIIGIAVDWDVKQQTKQNRKAWTFLKIVLHRSNCCVHFDDTLSMSLQADVIEININPVNLKLFPVN